MRRARAIPPEHVPIPFEVTTEVTGGGARVTAHGYIDLSTAARFEIALRDAAGDHDSVDVDLTDVEFMDSTGLRALMAAHRDERGGGIGVVAMSPQVQRLFRIAGVDGLIAR